MGIKESNSTRNILIFSCKSNNFRFTIAIDMIILVFYLLHQHDTRKRKDVFHLSSINTNTAYTLVLRLYYRTKTEFNNK